MGQILRGMARCVLFTVRGSSASIWRSSGVPPEATQTSRVSFSITSEPVFGLLGGNAFYRGPIPAGPGYDGFFRTLRFERPAEALILPAHLNDRLVALFYGDGGPTGEIQGETDEYRRLLEKLGLAMNILLIKRKILSI